MASEKNIFALSDFFSSLFHNFPKLLFTNVLFAVPFAVFFGIFWFINTASSINSNFILFLTAIPLFPFYAGVTQVTSHMARGEKDVKVFQTFINGVKENFLRFLLYGFIFYAAIFFSYYSIIMYSGFGRYNNAFYVLLVLCVIISVFFLFVFYYVPPMSVTFDLSVKNILKNSALMTFGEIKSNFIATFGLFVLFLVCATVLFCCKYAAAIIIATVVLALFFVPSLMSFIINSSIYKAMYSMITGKDEKSTEIDKKIKNRKKGQFYDNFEDKKNSVAESFAGLKVDESKDGDEYIFYNGRMIKRSVLIKLKKESEEKKENE